MLHCRYLLETRARHNPFRSELLAAPRAEYQIGFPCDHLVDRHQTILGCGLTCPIGEDVDAASDLDQLRNPPNSGDQRIVPLLEEYFGPLWEAFGPVSGSCQTALKPG